MRILGISAHYHDSAAALLVDGVPVCAVQEERLSRHKNDAAFPTGAIEWCLDHAGLDPADLDAVVFYERSLLKFERILTCTLRAFPRSWRSFPHAMKNSLGEKVWVRGIISSHLGVPAGKIYFTRHHEAHAAAAFLTAPTRRAAILTADGVGEWATLTVGHGERHADGRTGITRAARDQVPAFARDALLDLHRLSRLRGQRRRVQGHGPRRLRASDDDRAGPQGDPAHLRTAASPSSRSTSSSRRPPPDRTRSRFVDLFGPPRNPYDPIDLETAEGRRFADCAASVQRVLEDTLVDIARALHRETGLADLCYGGGVALNGVANARLLAESGFERVFVPPAPGDAGCALGAALYADRIYFRNPDREFPDHPFWGPVVAAGDLARAAREDEQDVAELEDAELIERVADALADGRVVGWMDGATEFGPRALGHRSILAAPHSADMRDRLNRDIKYREEFRPFAPVVPVEAAETYFELPPGGARLARFMSGVFPVRPEWRERLAAVTHVDGSARLQALERGMAPRLHALLEAYGRRTGIPILLNTSFNLSGEPIVTHALEGYSSFRRCGIDMLVAGPTLVSKRAVRTAKPAKEDVSW